MVSTRKKPLLERLLIKGSGVYAFYPFDKLDRKGCGVYKIGMTCNMDNRVRNYHTYLPQGVYYKCLLKNPTKLQSTLNRYDYYVSIEKEIFQNIKKNGGKVISMDIRKNNNGETEWIYANEKMVEDAFDEAYKKYGGKNTDLEIGDLAKTFIEEVPKLETNKIFKGEIYFCK